MKRNRENQNDNHQNVLRRGQSEKIPKKEFLDFENDEFKENEESEKVRGKSIDDMMLLQKPITRRSWTISEDALLREAVNRHSGSQWKEIAKCVPGRSHVQCLQRWNTSLHPDVIKGRWTTEEDQQLLSIVNQNPHLRNWGFAARLVPGRTAKQCRERYTHHLDPNIKKGNWTRDEDVFIIESHKKLGNRWAEIAAHLPGRTENSIKIRVGILKKREKKMKNFSSSANSMGSSGSSGSFNSGGYTSNKGTTNKYEHMKTEYGTEFDTDKGTGRKTHIDIPRMCGFKQRNNINKKMYQSYDNNIHNINSLHQQDISQQMTKALPTLGQQQEITQENLNHTQNPLHAAYLGHQQNKLNNSAYPNQSYPQHLLQNNNSFDLNTLQNNMNVQARLAFGTNGGVKYEHNLYIQVPNGGTIHTKPCIVETDPGPSPTSSSDCNYFNNSNNSRIGSNSLLNTYNIPSPNIFSPVVNNMQQKSSNRSEEDNTVQQVFSESAASVDESTFDAHNSNAQTVVDNERRSNNGNNHRIDQFNQNCFIKTEDSVDATVNVPLNPPSNIFSS